ncbi:MAG: hypothetical protein FJ020_00815 [Chloroflexi bacterium]|nr:hypothetical protein [Chloroflexota bacterium]
MRAEPKKLLDAGRRHLKLAPSAEREILCELYTHLDDRVEELEASGLSEEEAVAAAAREFGSLTAVVGDLNEVHSGNTWPQTLLAALPHIFFSLLFALQQWSSVGWLTVIVLSVVGVVVHGWRHGRPTWFFTWLGYALIPLLAVGLIIMDRALDRGSPGAAWWLWTATAAYFGVVAALFGVIMAQILKRDWLLGSLTIMPFLAVIGWFLTAQWRDRLLPNGAGTLEGLELWIALSLLTLAGIVILFTQLRERWLRVVVLLVAGLVVLMLMTLSSGGSIGVLNIAVLGVVALVVLLGPAVMDRWVVHTRAEPWEEFLEERFHH